MNTANIAFNPALSKISNGKKLRQGLSGIVRVDDTLWVANDETISLERLTISRNINGEHLYECGAHKQFLLEEYLSLPVQPDDKGSIEEADIEGLDYKDGYLWLVGSHSLKRKKAKRGSEDKENLKNLADVSIDGNRFLLARIPLKKENSIYIPTKNDGENHIAAQLRGGAKGNDLTKELREDKHLKSFMDIPGKDNGFDIEGLAVAGDNHVFVGLRGPVLRGWAIILELKLIEIAHKNDGVELRLKSVKKYFLELDGLGIRDLAFQEQDLLILAGPTMNPDGPVAIYRWKNCLSAKEKSFIFSSSDIDKVQEIDYGTGVDHAEGMALFTHDTEPPAVMLVYDLPADKRIKVDNCVTADILSL